MALEQAKLKLDADMAQARVNAQMELLKLERSNVRRCEKRKKPVILLKTEPISVQRKRNNLVSGGNGVINMPSVAVSDSCRFSAVYTCPSSSQIFASSANTVSMSSLVRAKEFVPASSHRQSTVVPATSLLIYKNI